ncbi:hypothetical protein MGN01_08630 [Methylobacterium gnaphalii]|uniref:Uncharacterized protein n=1 Tax=Methylobacterium gnaphalii TaxID=1010610 RepID=A0A512JGD7_9HYPH|nr:hypothetical protein MGN01_08630 [Methylobacterium gnaphalii]
MNLQTKAPDCAKGTRNLADGSAIGSASLICDMRTSWFMKCELLGVCLDASGNPGGAYETRPAPSRLRDSAVFVVNAAEP